MAWWWRDGGRLKDGKVNGEGEDGEVERCKCENMEAMGGYEAETQTNK